MSLLFRSLLVSSAAVTVTSTVFAEDAAPAPKQAEYKRGDASFYPRGDVLKFHPGSVTITKDKYTQKDDSYFFTPKVKAPKELYAEIAQDWIEPITAPDMAPLNIAPDAMQIREPQGDVTMALPSAPGNFTPVAEGMTVPNGAVIKTGPNATTAILFGGVDSARLIPGSEAAVQQTVTPQTRSVEVDLTVGCVFSKVGTQVGVKGNYEVDTPTGDAINHGGDFVTLIAQGHTDVWIAQGTVELVPPNEKKGETSTSDGTGPLKLLRTPPLNDPKEALAADTDGLTALFNFIPMANQKVAALRAQIARSTPLSDTQTAYLGRIKQVPAFIKLALVEPPAPPQPIAAAPVVAPVPPPAPPKPETVVIHPNGTVKFLNARMGLADFQAKLKALLTKNPDQVLVLKASPKVPYAKFKAILDSCTDVKQVTVEGAPVPPPTPGAQVTAETPPTPAVTTPPVPTAETTPQPATPAVVTPPAPPAPAPPPIVVGLDATGTTFIDGATVSEDDLKSKLADAAKANPLQEVTPVKRPKVPHAEWQKVVDLGHADKLKVHVLNEKEFKGSAALFPVPPPPPAPAPAPSVTEVAPAPAPTPAPVPPPAPPPANLPWIGLKADDKLFMDGAEITEDDLKSKFADIAKANPGAQLVLIKTANVSHDKWEKIVDLAHAANLKLRVLDARDDKTRIAKEAMNHSTPSPFPAVEVPTTPPTPAEPAAPTAAAPPAAPAITPENAPPAVIGLDDDGKMTWDGEPATEDDLKAKLDDLAKTQPKDPLLMLKTEKVTRDQWQKIVTIVHAAKLKVRVVDAKNFPSTGTASAPVPAPDSEALAPHLAATPSPQKLVPMEIDIKDDGKMTLDGAPVTADDLKAKLGDLAKVNPQQPILIVRTEKSAAGQVNQIVSICHAAKLKVHIKTAKTFTPPAPPSSPADNLPAPSVRLHPTMQPLPDTPPATTNAPASASP